MKGLISTRAGDSASSLSPTQQHDYHPEARSGYYEQRRYATAYLFQLFGCTEQEDWRALQIIPEIMRRLKIADKSLNSIIEVLRQVLEAERKDEKYDANAGARRRGRVPKINDNDPEANVIFRALVMGLTIDIMTGS